MQLVRNAFKAYDIRGKVPSELNEEIAYRIGRCFVALFQAQTVVVGRDIRLSSAMLQAALVRGLTEGGCQVLDIGLCGTEQIYFATAHWKLDGGIMITASHNPQEYNGMKLVGREARPISGDSGLRQLEDAVMAGLYLHPSGQTLGSVRQLDVLPDYIEHLLGYVDRAALKPFRVVVNAGNGTAGAVIDALENHLPFEFIKVHHAPDGSFPNGIPNPLLVENREATASVVRQTGADFGIAWDGDFDRCFLFDENGIFIEGYYIVGFLAQAFLRKHPGAKIIHDPRLTWNTIEVVTAAGGIPLQHKTGHAFIKERMRQEDAIYGGEMSAHHYFRDFAYCDSGMIPWLLVAEIMSLAGKPLSALLAERTACFPVSGEINSHVSQPEAAIARLEAVYGLQAIAIDRMDGLGMEFDGWRFNVRMSNTEQVLRLNVEARGDAQLMQQKTAELLSIIDS